MMGAKHLGHGCRVYEDIGVVRRFRLQKYEQLSLCPHMPFGHGQAYNWGFRSSAHLQHDPSRVLSLPVTVYNVQFDKVTSVGVKRAPDEIDIVHVIEVPALSNQRVTEDIFEGDGILVEAGRHPFSPDKLERRFLDDWTVPLNRSSSPGGTDVPA